MNCILQHPRMNIIMHMSGIQKWRIIFHSDAFESALSTMWLVEKITNKCNTLMIYSILWKFTKSFCIPTTVFFCAFFLADLSHKK